MTLVKILVAALAFTAAVLGGRRILEHRPPGKPKSALRWSAPAGSAAPQPAPLMQRSAKDSGPEYPSSGAAPPAPSQAPAAEPKQAAADLRPKSTTPKSRAGFAQIIETYPDPVALFGLVLFALALRVTGIGSIPAAFGPAEADALQAIYAVKAQGAFGPFGLDWNSAPALRHYLGASFLAIFGDGLEGLRLATALVSAFTVVPFYVLARQHLSRLASTIGAIMFVSSLWFLHFSRGAWAESVLVLFTVMAGLLVSLGVRHQQLGYSVGAGVFAALAFYAGGAGWTILLALLIFVLLLIWQTPSARAPLSRGLAALIGGWLLAVLPHFPALLANLDSLNRRLLGETIFAAEVGPGLLQQLTVAIRGFLLLDAAPGTGQIVLPGGEPAVQATVALLFLAGLVVAARAWRETALWWCLLAVPLVLSQLLLVSVPNWGLAIVVAPVVFLFAAFAIDRLVPRPGLTRGAFQLVVVVATPILVFNVTSGYFDWASNPAAVQAQAPAVNVTEFEYWRNAQFEAIAGGGRGFTVEEWNTAVRARTVPANHLASAMAPVAARPGGQQQTAITRPQPVLSPVDAATPNAATLIGLVGSPGSGDGRYQVPRGVAIDGAGYIYVADVATSRIHKFSPDGTFITAWGRPYGGEGSGRGEFTELAALRVDRTRQILYALDNKRGLIQAFGLDGSFRAILGAEMGAFSPRGLGIDAQGNLYVADTGHNRIVKLSAAGQVIQVIGQPGQQDGLLIQPTDVALDATGNMFVAEPEASRIQKLSPSGQVIAWWPIPKTNTLDAPHLAITASGHLLATEPSQNRVNVYTPDGLLVAFWSGDPGMAVGIDIGAGGQLAVADPHAGTVVLGSLNDAY